MLFVLLAFFAGVITVFAPCVLPILPIIIGGSITGKVQDKKRPLIIAASLAISLLLFTVLLKATTLFINVPPETFTFASGIILVILGIALFFPDAYDTVIVKLNLQVSSQRFLGKAHGKNPWLGAVITGAALGPVFSSCSPVYAYILASVLPVNFSLAMVYIVAYVLGLSAMLLLIGYLGQRFTKRIKFLSNPRGWFIRSIAILFILVGLLIMTGYDKKLQTWVSDHTPFNFDGVSAKLIPDATKTDLTGVLNVTPYKAPEFAGLENWINSQPLKLSDLKGKVVLVDFWTYSCINCIRTQPYLKQWYSMYKDSGFVIIGVHAPEFAFERVPENVAKATKDAGLEYPVALDNDYATWNNYKNQFWPASYLIDKQGNVRRFHGGEGEYKEEEQAIRLLLQENGGTVPGQKPVVNSDAPVPVTQAQTPETYLGTDREDSYVGNTALSDGTKSYTAGKLTAVNQWTLGGQWQVTSEGITAIQDATLKIRAAAKDIYLVTGNNTDPAQIQVKLNGTPASQTGSAGRDVENSAVTVSAAQLYKLISYSAFNTDGTVELSVPAGVQLNVFTFGS